MDTNKELFPGPSKEGNFSLLKKRGILSYIQPCCLNPQTKMTDDDWGGEEINKPSKGYWGDRAVYLQK